MCWEFHRNIEPDRTLLIDMGVLTRGFAVHPERYPDATTVAFDGVSLPEDQVRKWLRGLDVVYSAETFYDWRMVEWARDEGVATVLHVMPEFYRHDDAGLPRPDRFWAPTAWRLDLLPPETRLVPVPVALDRFTPRHVTKVERLIHVAGHRAAADRAGTTSVLRALRHITTPMTVVLITQDKTVPGVSTKRGVVLERRAKSMCEYWELYDHGDALVAPRRYGGLSLPFNEAAAAGLPMILPDSPPHRETWPGMHVRTQPAGDIATSAGRIVLHATDAHALAAAMTTLVTQPSDAADLSAASIAWAKTHSWDALRGLYLTALQEATKR